MACADEFIRELPDGYDTYFSGTSVQFSGGQMHRIGKIAFHEGHDPTKFMCTLQL
jgi:ABC-type multidrug transport system fused ATPase/permease subunit